MAGIDWYWHRLRSMEATEVVMHCRKKLLQATDRPPARRICLENGSQFPTFPSPRTASEAVASSLRQNAEAVMRGDWKFFGHHLLKVDDPPRWHRDYLAGIEVSTRASGFKLNHRELPSGADIKLVWELSRWQHLAQLAQAGWFFKEERFAAKCVQWLEDWVKCNPPYAGWNWTSALESGLRLIQFTWIDAFIEQGPAFQGHELRLRALRENILLPHARFTWRYRSFGSSANNHLIGELAGLIVAVVRWPDLAGACADLSRLQQLWEHEVLSQFAEDGGNREQALHYHLFSWELCFHARLAFMAAKIEISQAVQERLEAAERFFVNVQSEREPWDYGDSDDALVVPLASQDEVHSLEWMQWMQGTEDSALGFWIGGKKPGVKPELGWNYFETSGYVTFRSIDWFLRWDVSPLGYLNTAAHGHLDALHLSLWYKGSAVVIDPGTGAYYADAQLRNYLASANAHNGPVPKVQKLSCRRGPFLWSKPHVTPKVEPAGTGFRAELIVPKGKLVRTVTPLPESAGWEINDEFATEETEKAFTVLWQFAPGMSLEQTGEREFRVRGACDSLVLQAGREWSSADPGLKNHELGPQEGTVSPFFRQICSGPFLKLTAPTQQRAGIFQSRFLVCE